MDTDAQREDKVKSQKKEGHVMTEAEIRGMQLRAKELQSSLAPVRIQRDKKHLP